MNMTERLSSRNIRADRRLQYATDPVPGESPYNRADDLRRNLILKYAVHPSNLGKEGMDPRDMWEEIGEGLLALIGPSEEKLGVDMGTSSGYFIDLMLRLGYKGGILGIDAEAHHLGNVATRINLKHPNANIWLGKADAESMRHVDLVNNERLKIHKNTFDWSTQLNIHHHTGDAEQAINTAVKVTKNGGYAVFMDRAVGHLRNMYKIGELVAAEFNANPPIPWYVDFDFTKLEAFLDKHKQLRIIEYGHPQGEYMWIPDTEEGWKDYIDPFYTLVPHMTSNITGERLRKSDVESFVENEIREKLFKLHASYEDGYFTDYIFQKYFICQVIK